jgi:signal transduction histidine kinase
MEQAFEPFSALRGMEPGPGRRPGKGLPHCAQLMTAYGGTVVLESSEGGTRVRISLPME